MVENMIEYVDSFSYFISCSIFRGVYLIFDTECLIAGFRWTFAADLFQGKEVQRINIRVKYIS